MNNFGRQGWVKLHRRLLDWQWYKDVPVRIVFEHLLLTANHKEGRFAGHDVPVGSTVTGRKSLADQTGLTEKQVRNALKKLENTGELAIKRASKFSIISIVKWSDYQDEGQQGASRGPAEGQQRATLEECKNIRKEEEVIEPNGSLSLPVEATTPTPKGEKYPEDFEKFWSAYPKRKGTNSKKEAFKKWQGYIRGGVPASLIIQGAEGYAKDRAGQDATYTQQAKTWLNQAGWEQYAAHQKPQLVHSSQTVCISVHDEPDLFDIAVHWAKRHLPYAIRHGQEHIKIPEHVAKNLRKQAVPSVRSVL